MKRSSYVLAWGIVIAIALVVGLIAGTSAFYSLDSTAVTEADFKSLDEQRIAVEQNHKLLFASKCAVKIEK